MTIRNFKKEVEYFVGDFVDDCTLFITLNPHKNADKMSEVVSEAVDLYNDLKDKANVKVDKKERKAWFVALRKEMYEKVDALYEKLSAIVSEKDAE